MWPTFHALLVLFLQVMLPGAFSTNFSLLHLNLAWQVFPNHLFFVLTGTPWVHVLINWITAWLIT
jgi:hypothetical protein